MTDQIKAEIVRLMREEFDPKPPNYGGYSWDDRADAVADRIAALFTHTAVQPTASVEAVRDGETLARRFHDTYELLAPSFGYETRKDTRQFDPTTPNGRLMIAVCSEIIASLTPATTQGAWQWRSRIKGGAWDAWEQGRFGGEPPPFMDVEERQISPTSSAPVSAPSPAGGSSWVLLRKADAQMALSALDSFMGDTDPLEDTPALLACQALSAALEAPKKQGDGPDDATPEMVAAALKVDWANEDEEAVVHNVWHVMRAAMPKRTPPAGGVREALLGYVIKPDQYETATVFARGQSRLAADMIALIDRAALSSPATPEPVSEQGSK